MADHFVGLYRGVEGFQYKNFVTGTSSTATTVFELRVLDGVGAGTVADPRLRKLEVLKALDAFERYFQNDQQVILAGFDVVT